MTNNPARPIGKEIADDTARARKGISPPILVGVYGANAPKAAKFNGGVSDTAGATEAADAMRNAKPGDYYSDRNSDRKR